MEKGRIQWIDHARAMAIICVVLCHSVESTYYSVRTGVQQVGQLSWLFQTTAFIIGRMGVPLFLMITGALQLNRKMEPIKFYKHTLLPLLLTTEIWIVLYSFINCAVHGKWEFDLVTLIRQMLFLESTAYNHVWYLYTVLGLYLCVPFLSEIFRTFKPKQLLVVLIVSFLVFFILPLYNMFAGEAFSSWIKADNQLDISFLGGIYGMYLFLGWYLSQKENAFSKWKSHTLLFSAVVSVALCIGCEYYLFSRKLFYSNDAVLWYCSPFILICAVMLFAWIQKLRINEILSNFLRYISKISFAIYLLHNIFRQIFDLYFADMAWFDTMNIVEKVTVRFIVCFELSVLVCICITRIPSSKLKKALFFLR